MTRVYIVDDEAAIVKWLRESVDWEQYGCAVCGSSTSALEAVSFLEREEVDLLVTDIGMPDMDGLTLIRHAKQVHPQLHILIISAHGDFNFAKQAVRLGAEDYLLKPLDRQELDEALARLASAILRGHPHQDDYRLFQNNVLQRWVTGSIDGADFREQAQIAGLNIRRDTYTVLMVTARGLPHDDLLHAYHRCRTLGADRCEGFFLSHSLDIVGVLPLDTQSVRAFAAELMQALHAELKTEVFIAVGLPVGHYLQVGVGYESAAALRPAAAFLNGHVCCAEDYPPLFEIAQNDLFRKLTALIKGGNASKAADTALALVAALGPEHEATALFAVAVALLGKLPFTAAQTLPPAIAEAAERFAAVSADEGSEWLKSFIGAVAVHHGEDSGLVHPYVSRALQRIAGHYADPQLHLRAVAEELGVTPIYFGQLFLAQTGTYFNDYLTDIRLEEVCALLTGTNEKIGEIARRVGFSSQSYLNRVFRKKYHVSPMEYRQRGKRYIGDKGD